MTKAVVSTLLGISIALMQFILLIPVWARVFGSYEIKTFFHLAIFGAIILALLLIGLILYPNMPLRNAILGTLIGVGVAIIVDVSLFLWAYNNSGF